MSSQTAPFKFLDSYTEEDNDIFFGREQETQALYEALSGVKHLLVYGPSGAGKTSLVECGLRNQFSDADWFALTIRRGADMAGSVFAAINDALHEKLPLDPHTRRPLDSEINFGQALENLFSERYQPVYLLFDQFEELLISGSEEEKKDFFSRLNQLIRYRIPCRVMLIMREEFIGHLSEFEPLCPSIFQHRFRVEKMRKENVKEVIRQTLDARYFNTFFRVNNSGQLAESILARLPDKSREIELAHVQVFLSELWDRACQAAAETALPLLHVGLIRPDDNLAGVLDSFLKKQLTELDAVFGEKAPLETLAAMISERHTKLQVSAEALQQELADKAVHLKAPLASLLHGLEKRRILRSIRSGDLAQYEISHDVLALVVGRNLTEEMQLREKARDIYRVYEGREGLLSQEDLDYLRPFEGYLALPDTLARRMQESEAELARRRREELEATRRRLRTVRGLLGLALLAVGVAIFFGLNARLSEAEANRQREEADRQKTEAIIQQEKAEAERERAERLLAENIEKDSLNRVASYNRLIAEAQNLQSQRRYDEAIGRYETAKAFARDTLSIMKAIQDCQAARSNQDAFSKRMQEAEAHTRNANYQSAIEAYRRAIVLKVNPGDIQVKLSGLKNTLQENQRKDKSAADALSYDLARAKPYRDRVQQSERFLIQIQDLINQIQ